MRKNIQIGYEVNKLNALNQYMNKKEVTLQEELEEFMDKLYEKHVPVAVREFIGSMEQEAKLQTRKPKQKRQDSKKENLTNLG